MVSIYDVKDKPIIIEKIQTTKFKKKYTLPLLALQKDVVNEIIKTYGLTKKIVKQCCEPFPVFHYNQNCSINKDNEYSYYSWFVLECHEKTQLFVFSCMNNNHCKFWLDGKFIGIDRGIAKYFFELNKGYHLFIFEKTDGGILENINFRINKIQSEASYKYTSLLDNNMHYSDIPGARFLDSENCDINLGNYDFMITPFDHINTDFNQLIDIVVCEKGTSNILFNLKSCFYAKISFDFKFLLNQNIYIEIIASWIDLKMKKQQLKRTLYFGDYKLEYKKIKMQCSHINNSEHYCEEEKCIALHYTENIFAAQYVEPVKLYHIKHVLNKVESGEYKSEINLPGNRRICFKSIIDNQISFYAIYLPPQFDIKKKYPLLIRVSTISFETCSRLFSKEPWEDIIVVDIPIRGITSGCYIGELAFKETLYRILNKYNVDQSRIYAFGYSNGATAIWTISQAYPDLFAAVACYSGVFDCWKLRNLSNSIIFHIQSKYDEQYINIKKKYVVDLSGYEQIFAEAYNHFMLKYISFNSQIIRKLLQHKKTETPHEIYYLTKRNRHNSSYWLKINSVLPKKKYGKIKAKIEDGNIIIQTQNIEAFTILPTIPQQLDGLVLINGKKAGKLIANNNKPIFFKKSTRGFEKKSTLENGTLYRGSGILDVFFNPLKIINLCPKSNEMQRSAEMFASPRVNAYKPNIEVHYPLLLSEHNLNKILLNLSSFIVLDNNVNSETLDTIRKNCKIIMVREGFWYLDKYYGGEYCIMQIITNPFNNKYSLLYINSNNKRLYFENFFTRNIVIPTYLKQNVLNNDILIFWNDKYYTVYDSNALMPIENIHNLNGN